MRGKETEKAPVNRIEDPSKAFHQQSVQYTEFTLRVCHLSCSRSAGKTRGPL
jgi:hypothetical protein